MVAKRSSRAVALLLALPSASFALGFGDIRLLSPLNAPLDAEIELVDVTPEELQSLQAQIASRDTFSRYGLEFPNFLSSVQVRTVRNPDGKEVIKLKSNESVTEPFITLLIEVNWARGRMVREYTMLMDPPVFTPGQADKPALANAPVAPPATGAGTREGSIARSATSPPPALPPLTAEEPAVPSESSSATTASAEPSPGMAAPPAPEAMPAPPAPAAPSRAERAEPSSAMEANTHVVKRGETLSQIATGVTGTRRNSPQAHVMMLAIYQANPSAFEKNMNLLRSGSVLRIPDSADVAAVSPGEAAAEIRRQYAAWRGTAAPSAAARSKSGELRLVTPTEPASAGTGGSAPGEVKALQSRVHDLEGQLNDSKRLLEMRNAELADLQSRLSTAQRGGQTAAAPEPAAPEPPSAAPPAAAEPPVAQTEQKPESGIAPPAEEPPAQTAEPAQPPMAAAAPRPVTKPAPEPQGGGILDTVMEYWWVGAALVLGLLGLAGFRFWRSRRETTEFDDSIGRLAVAGAASVDRGFASGDTAPMRPIPAAAGDGAFLVEESGTHERPRFGGAAAPAAPATRHVATDETISSDTAINLDQGDPLAEADFHMAYGLYDQAADLIRIAIQREPARRDLKLKLLEVFFVWGNKEQFLQTARELADSRADAAPGEWEKIVIMGKQLAPEDPLFSGGPVGSGATAGGVDLDLEGGQSRVDFDLLGEPVPGAGEVDLDIGSALGDADPTAESPNNATDRASALDRAFGNSTGTTREMTARMPAETGDLSEFATEGPTVEQPALNTPENATIRQKVEMALKKGGQAQEQTAELAIDDLGLDLGALDTMNQPGLAASADAPTLVAGLDERSRKIMEEAQRRASHEDKTSGTGAWQLDEAELESALANGGDDHDGNGLQTSATSRLASLGSRNVDYDLSESGMAHATNGAGLDLDVGTATVPDTGFTATQRLSSDDLALPDIEPVTMSEVGTKLDLARAYMDMGDPDGARNILEEVLNEGSVAQKQEAQRLMESLPG